ncbi:hypothetical protein LTR39_002917, partial [Cryomyces antarcticus]
LDSKREKEEEIHGLNRALDNLYRETQAAQEREAEAQRVKYQEINGLNRVIENLQTGMRTLQQQQHDLETEKAREAVELKKVVEHLQHEIQTIQHGNNDLASERQAEAEQQKQTINHLREELNRKERANDDTVTEKDIEIDRLSEKLGRLRFTLEERHEEELRGLREEHAADLRALEADLQSEQKKLLEELQTRHNDTLAAKTKFEEDLAELSKKHAADLEANEEVKRQHDSHVSEVEAARGSLLAERDRLINKLKEINRDHAAARKALEELEIAHERTLAELEASSTRGENTHNEAMDALRQDHHETLKAREEKHESGLQQLREELEAASSVRIDEAEKTHVGAIETLQGLHARALREHKEAAELRGELEAAAAEKIAKLESTHANVVETLQQKLDTQNVTLKMALADLDLAKTSSERSLNDDHMHTATICQFQNELEQQKVALAEAQRQLADTALAAHEAEKKYELHMVELKKELAAQARALERELDGANKAATVHSIELDTFEQRIKAEERENIILRASLAQVEALCEQYEGKAGIADQITSENDDLRKKVSATMAKLEATTTELSQLKAEGQSFGEHYSSPRLGLGVRKWANAFHDSPDFEEKENEDPDGGALEEREDEDGRIGVTLEGTLASLQVQAKQLEELNEDWLSGLTQ